MITALNTSSAGLGPVTRIATTVDGSILHTIVHESVSKLVSVIFLVNNFTTCTPTPKPPPTPPANPAPATDVSVYIAPPSTSAGAVLSAVDVVSGQALATERVHGANDGREWRIMVGTVHVHSIVVVTFA